MGSETFGADMATASGPAASVATANAAASVATALAAASGTAAAVGLAVASATTAVRHMGVLGRHRNVSDAGRQHG